MKDLLKRNLQTANYISDKELVSIIIPTKEVKFVIIDLPDKNKTKQKTSGPDGFTGKFYQPLEEEINNINPTQTIIESRGRVKTAQLILCVTL